MRSAQALFTFRQVSFGSLLCVNSGSPRKQDAFFVLSIFAATLRELAADTTGKLLKEVMALKDWEEIIMWSSPREIVLSNTWTQVNPKVRTLR
jgi:hypothetical protein